MGAYYNEFDKEKAAWLRELIKVGVIADGEVDERSICDVRGDELRGFTQWHFFAGIGVWSYALRLAGWPDDRPVCTASFPCPSFSCAGKGQGFDDPRHLWPVGERLFGEFRPPVIFGEQSDDAIGYGWLDLVQTSLEKMSYSVGKAVLASASVGASDIRQRLYWVADCDSERFSRRTEQDGSSLKSEFAASRWNDAGRSGAVERLADHASERLEIRGCGESTRCESLQRPERLCPTSGMADSDDSERGRGELRLHSSMRSGDGIEGHAERPETRILSPFAGTLKGYWRDADWLLCTDGRWRPVEPGTFPLAHGAPARLGRLRGYGDAINSQAAKAFIESYQEARGLN